MLTKLLVDGQISPVMFNFWMANFYKNEADTKIKRMLLSMRVSAWLQKFGVLGLVFLVLKNTPLFSVYFSPNYWLDTLPGYLFLVCWSVSFLINQDFREMKKDCVALCRAIPEAPTMNAYDLRVYVEEYLAKNKAPAPRIFHKFGLVPEKKKAKAQFVLAPNCLVIKVVPFRRIAKGRMREN